MSNKSKRVLENQNKITAQRLYPLAKAIDSLKACSLAKFNESVDVAIHLGVDPRKSDQVVRSSSAMPNGTGKSVRVAVFAQGVAAEKAEAAGADIVGFESLFEDIKAGKIEFEQLIATPDSMRLVGQLGQILGPKGLMPNPKLGTVTSTPDVAVKLAKAGQVKFRTDKNGIIHCLVGKIDFTTQALTENLIQLVTDLKRRKPAASKGKYIKRAYISSTMGPSLELDVVTLEL